MDATKCRATAKSPDTSSRQDETCRAIARTRGDGCARRHAAASRTLKRSNRRKHGIPAWSVIRSSRIVVLAAISVHFSRKRPFRDFRVGSGRLWPAGRCHSRSTPSSGNRRCVPATYASCQQPTLVFATRSLPKAATATDSAEASPHREERYATLLRRILARVSMEGRAAHDSRRRSGSASSPRGFHAASAPANFRNDTVILLKRAI